MVEKSTHIVPECNFIRECDNCPGENLCHSIINTIHQVEAVFPHSAHLKKIPGLLDEKYHYLGLGIHNNFLEELQEILAYFNSFAASLEQEQTSYLPPKNYGYPAFGCKWDRPKRGCP